MLPIKVSPLIRQYVVVILVNLSCLCVGLGVAWPSPVLVKLRNATETVLTEPMTDDQGSWIVSIGYIFATVANVIPAYLADKIGRKQTLLLGSVCRVVSCLLLTFATRVSMILAGRIVNSVADCAAMTIVPIYASEIASKEVRGTLGIILQISCSLGILLMYSIGPFVSYVFLNSMLTVCSLLAAAPLVFLPDSPYSLFSKGKTDDAKEVLSYLRGSEAEVNQELKEYGTANQNQKVDRIAVFKDKIVLKALLIVTVLGALGQLCGFNAVTMYLQTILESTRTSITPETASVIIGFIQLSASLCSVFVTDRFGRKPVLCVTVTVTTVGMIGLGVFFWLKEDKSPVTGFLNSLPLISLILVMFFFSAGPGSIFFMLITELFEGPGRAIGVSCSIITCSVFIFLTTKYFPLLISAIGPDTTYWIFAVICIIYVLFVWFCLPETKGKSFSEIQKDLGAKVEIEHSDEELEKDNKVV